MTSRPTVVARGLTRRLAAGLAVVVSFAPSTDAAADPPPATAAVEPAGPLPLLDAEPARADRRRPAPVSALPDWRVLGAIAAAFVALVVARGRLARRAPPLPSDVFEVLGAAALGGQHGVRIVRFGPKTLLVGVSASGLTTLAELADPQATARIAAACGGARPPRVTGPRPATAAAPGEAA